MRQFVLEGARGCAAPQVAALGCHGCFGKRSIARATATAAATAAAATSTAAAANKGKHYVVVGAGLAGLATAYHLLKQSPHGAPAHVTVYDAVGIGAGGSGAAAGLLHPFAPTGKLLWRAQDAMQAALELLEAAEAAAVQDPGMPDGIAWLTGMLKPATSAKQSQSFWRLYGRQQQQQQRQQQQQQSLHHDRQAGLQTAAHQIESMLSGAVVGVSTAQQLVPGVQLPITAAAGHATDNSHQLSSGFHETASTQQEQQPKQQQQQQKRRRKQQAPPAPPADWSAEQCAALYLQGGITLQPQHYLHALWSACQQVAAARLDGSSAQLKIQQLQSLSDLLLPQHHVPGVSVGSVSSNKQSQQDGCKQTKQQQQQQDVNGIVVAAGAAVGSLAEIGQQLPLTLCQGYTLDMVPPAAAATAAAAAARASTGAAGASTIGGWDSPPTAAAAGAAATAAAAAATAAVPYPASGPSLLGVPYLASQGGQVLVVGATKQYDCTTEQALAELGRTIYPGVLSAQQQHPAVSLPNPADGLSCEQQPGQGGGGACAAAAAAAGGDEAAEVAAAAAELVAGAAAVWPGVGGWSVGGIRSGVRALPPRSAAGSLPIAGRWMDLTLGQRQADEQQQQWRQADEQQQQQQADEQQQEAAEGGCGTKQHSVPVWLLVGLGARGLVYHAWLGQLMAAAVLSGSEEHLPPELLAWR